MGSMDLDPELEALLSGDDSGDDVPDFSDLFEEEKSTSAGSNESGGAFEDLTKENFPSIDKYEQDPDPVFFSKDYYQKVLTGEGENATRVHNLLQKYLKAEDPKDKGIFRQQLIPAWWDLVKSLATHYQNGNIEKRWALRFGYLLPTLITTEQRRVISKIIPNNNFDEPIHYVDEWLDLLLDGKVNALATDELKISKIDRNTKVKMQMEKAKGSSEANLSILKTLMAARSALDSELVQQIKIITSHEKHLSVPEIQTPYSPEQKLALNRINEILRKLSKLDKDIQLNIEKYKDAEKELGLISDKIQQMGGLTKADQGAIQKEIDSIHQMAKMCVGKRGNHLPILMKNFFFPKMDLIGTRENVLRYMDQIEQVDPGVFRRVFRQKSNRIVPHVLLIPSYGEKGVCWEPFERYNRSTSRGRIAVPMFPRDLKLAVIYALGDLRWQVAKEKAAHYWMEEGLTGYYYQWFSSKKMRGDVRLRFLDDYYLWITKEVDGVQKLDKEVRAIFWRLMPFPQPVKDTLRNRGFVYNELYKKDMNRAMSDGY